jgi:hypothetical protein
VKKGQGLGGWLAGRRGTNEEGGGGGSAGQVPGRSGRPRFVVGDIACLLLVALASSHALPAQVGRVAVLHHVNTFGRDCKKPLTGSVFRLQA